MKQLALINPEEVTEDEVQLYKVRKAARAVVLDENNYIALLTVTDENYFKLPGGGIEEHEDILTALNRECTEEIGCNIEVLHELGSIIEYRKVFKLKQISYCFLAKTEGRKGISNFTQEELDKGFEVVWLPIEEALNKLLGVMLHPLKEEITLFHVIQSFYKRL